MKAEGHRGVWRVLLSLFGGFLVLHAQPDGAVAHPAEVERIAILTGRIEARPQDPHLYIDRGAAYSHDGKYALAMEDLKKAAQLGDPVLVAYELGLLHFRRGELEQAKSELDMLFAVRGRLWGGPGGSLEANVLGTFSQTYPRSAPGRHL